MEIMACIAGILAKSSFKQYFRVPSKVYHTFNKGRSKKILSEVNCSSAFLLSSSEGMCMSKHGDVVSFSKVDTDQKFECNVPHRLPVQEEFNFAEHLYHILKNDQGHVPAPRILKVFNNAGLWSNDPRLSQTMDALKGYQSSETKKYSGSMGEVLLDFDEFKTAIHNNIPLIKKVFTDDLVIPEFQKFCITINQLHTDCKAIKTGKVASYIPQLSKYNPDNWGVSLCTIDGQRFSAGDTKIPFTLQSSSKPLTYALAINERGADEVHKYVGYEPSGESFNSIKLNQELKPHNPMINSGAIVVGSMIRSQLSMGERFDYVQNQYKALAGGDHVGFNNSIYLSEKETANRNLAIGYYLKEHNCFPPGTSLEDALDFYFMMCSVEVNANSASVIAATLANGGYCPLTQEPVLSPISVRNTLALMHSCGMYDYSGTFAFKVGLPSKSSVSGCILLVIPNVLGMCLWSPPLDLIGNSVRGVHFCEQLVECFNFHNYDSLLRTRKTDPRQRHSEYSSSKLLDLLFGAYNGDFQTLRRLALTGYDMNITDYDSRTALHVASSEGHLECVEFLIDRCRANVDAKDRWGQTPLDNAIQFKHVEIQRYIEEYKARNKV